MLLDILQLRKNPGVKQSFELKFEPDSKILSQRMATFEGEASFKGVYFYHDGSVHIEGEIEARIVFNCDKCLKPVTCLYNTPFFEVFYRESVDGGYTYEGDNLVPDRAVNEAMLLNLPSSTYCRSECRGLCPVCGTDLNTESCDCVIEPEGSGKNPFSSLERLLDT